MAIPQLDMKASKFDVTLIVQEEKDSISAQFQYSTELFKPSTIAK